MKIASRLLALGVLAAATGCGSSTESGLPPMSKSDENKLFASPTPASGDEFEPQIVAVSPAGDRLIRTVQPRRRGPPRADIELLSTANDDVLWRFDLAGFSVPNFGKGAWIENRVAMPKGELAGYTRPLPDTLTVVDVRPNRRRPVLVAHWNISPYPSLRTTTKHVTFESRDVVTAVVYPPAKSSAPPVHYRCTVGQPACASQVLPVRPK